MGAVVGCPRIRPEGRSPHGTSKNHSASPSTCRRRCYATERRASPTATASSNGQASMTGDRSVPHLRWITPIRRAAVRTAMSRNSVMCPSFVWTTRMICGTSARVRPVRCKRVRGVSRSSTGHVRLSGIVTSTRGRRTGGLGTKRGRGIVRPRNACCGLTTRSSSLGGTTVASMACRRSTVGTPWKGLSRSHTRSRTLAANAASALPATTRSFGQTTRPNANRTTSVVHSLNGFADPQAAHACSRAQEWPPCSEGSCGEGMATASSDAL